MDILQAIRKLSAINQEQLIQLLQRYLSAKESDWLKSFCDGTSITTEQSQELPHKLDAIFRNKPAVKYFLNNEKEGVQTVGQVIFGDNIAIASGYGVAISGVVHGSVHITHHHIDKPVPRLLTTPPQIDTTQVVGRDADIEKVKDLLQVSDKVLLMNGLGGIGKTTVAKVFLKENDNAFQHIAWLDVTGGNVKEAFVANRQLKDSLHLTETIDGLERNKDYFENAFAIIINRMRKLEREGNAPPNLLIIDNAQEDIEHSQTLDFIALKPHWKVLVTSREDLLGFEKYTLGLLSPKDAKALFYLHYAYKLDQQANAEALIEEILELIDYHTLSIELISKTAQAKRLTLAEVLETVKKKGLAVLESTEDDTYIQFLRNFNQRERKVYAFLLSIFELAGLDEMEQWTAKQFAVMPSISIRLEENKEGDEQNLTHLLQIEKGKQRSQFIDSLNSLQKSGWLTHSPEEDAFKMHNLIQEIMREKLKPEYEGCDRLCESIITLLTFDQEKDNPVDKFYWMDFGQDLLDYIFPFPSQKKGKLQNNLSLVYSASGNYKLALELMKTTLKNTLKDFGKSHTNVAACYSNLAITYKELGEYESAQKFCQIALEINIKNFGKIHPRVVKTQSNLALIYNALGKYESAQKLLQDALEANLQQFDTTSPITVLIQSNLAIVLQALGDYESARDLLQTALEANLQNFGISHPNVARLQYNLAMVLQDLGDYKSAQGLLQVALKTFLQSFGNLHPIVAQGQSNLAMSYYFSGNYKRAQDLFQAALKTFSQNFGEFHPNMAILNANLAGVYKALGDYKIARDLFQKALDITLHNFEETHPKVAVCKSNLGLVYRNLGDYESALDLLLDALETDIQHFPENHPTLAKRRSNLAMVLQDLGEYESAKNLFLDALVTDLQNFGINHPSVATVQSNLAGVCLLLGDYESARDLFQIALETNLQNFGVHHPIVAQSQSNLATVYLELGKKREAQVLFQQAYDTMYKTLGENHPDTKETKEWLDEC